MLIQPKNQYRNLQNRNQMIESNWHQLCTRERKFNKETKII